MPQLEVSMAHFSSSLLPVGLRPEKKKNAQANDDANIRPAVLKRSASAAKSCYCHRSIAESRGI